MEKVEEERVRIGVPDLLALQIEAPRFGSEQGTRRRPAPPRIRTATRSSTRAWSMLLDVCVTIGRTRVVGDSCGGRLAESWWLWARQGQGDDAAGGGERVRCGDWRVSGEERGGD